MSTGNSSRLSYDTTSYNAEVNQSVQPMNYYLNSYRFRNCDGCYPEVSQTYPDHTVRATERVIEIENTLSTRDRKNDKKEVVSQNVDKFPEEVQKYEHSFGLQDCSDKIRTSNSLLTNPKINYKGLSTQHLVFSHLPIDATNFTPIYGNPGFVSSRDVAIDEYKKIMESKGLYFGPKKI